MTDIDLDRLLSLARMLAIAFVPGVAVGALVYTYSAYDGAPDPWIPALLSHLLAFGILMVAQLIGELYPAPREVKHLHVVKTVTEMVTPIAEDKPVLPRLDGYQATVTNRTTAADAIHWPPISGAKMWRALNSCIVYGPSIRKLKRFGKLNEETASALIIWIKSRYGWSEAYQGGIRLTQAGRDGITSLLPAAKSLDERTTVKRETVP